MSFVWRAGSLYRGMLIISNTTADLAPETDAVSLSRQWLFRLAFLSARKRPPSPVSGRTMSSVPRFAKLTSQNESFLFPLWKSHFNSSSNCLADYLLPRNQKTLMQWLCLNQGLYIIVQDWDFHWWWLDSWLWWLLIAVKSSSYFSELWHGCSSSLGPDCH